MKKIFKNRAEWEAFRNSDFFIGGSNIATILGLNPYCTPFEYWKRIQSGQPDEETPEKLRGQKMEDAISDLLAAESCEKIVKQSAKYFVLTNDNLPEYIICSPDRETFKSGRKKRVLVEIKDTTKIIDLNNPEEIPEHWYTQVQWACGVGGYDAGILAIYGGDKKLSWRIFDFDKKYFDECVKAAIDWRQKYIIDGDTPPVETINDVKLKNPAPAVKEKNTTNGAFIACQRYLTLSEQIKKLEERRDTLKNSLAIWVDDAESLIFEGMEICTFKQQKTSRVNLDKLKNEFPAIYKACLEDSETRILRVKKCCKT